jgi:hypothetical protein
MIGDVGAFAVRERAFHAMTILRKGDNLGLLCLVCNSIKRHPDAGGVAAISLPLEVSA